MPQAAWTHAKYKQSFSFLSHKIVIYLNESCIKKGGGPKFTKKCSLKV
jgi:hypothetical protein